MRGYSEDLKFKAIDSNSGTCNLIDSTLDLVNNSGLSDERVRKSVASFLEQVTIDFHSDDTDLPRQLPAVYEEGTPKYDCSIYAPRKGTIKSISINPLAKVKYEGGVGIWERFSSEDTNYSVNI